jgi:enoyl-CoA hydratase/carnithine racemase
MITTGDDGGVRTITLDRPQVLNAFDTALYRAAAAAIEAARVDDGVKVVVVTGAGRAFSAGQDLQELERIAAGETYESGFPALLDALGEFDKPLIAAVNGVAVGIGFTMLAHCDLVLVADSARLRVPFSELGVPPEAASSWLFPQRMGWQRAAHLLFTSAWIDAAQAVEYGIALECVPASELLARAHALAADVARAPLPALRAIKTALRDGQRDAVRAARAREDDAFAAVLGLPVPPEGTAGS